MESKINELEKELESVLLLKKVLHDEKKVLVGLEYVIYIRDASVLLCALCDKQGDFFNMTNHIASLPHQLKFLVSL